MTFEPCSDLQEHLLQADEKQNSEPVVTSDPAEPSVAAGEGGGGETEGKEENGKGNGLSSSESSDVSDDEDAGPDEFLTPEPGMGVCTIAHNLIPLT